MIIESCLPPLRLHIKDALLRLGRGPYHSVALISCEKLYNIHTSLLPTILGLTYYIIVIVRASAFPEPNPALGIGDRWAGVLYLRHMRRTDQTAALATRGVPRVVDSRRGDAPSGK